MSALDILDSPLRWETERQNRIHQEAVEQKKKLVRSDSPRIARSTPAPISAGSRLPHTRLDDVAAVPSSEWADKVFRIPAMRSALIPLDEAGEGAEWSKPFSLQKADMEPWLSFYKGYKESRLFPEAPATGGQELLQPDFAVRALLELKRIDAKIVLEPPVQINAQVEYHDLETDLQAGVDPVRARALLRAAHSVHEKQLAQAVMKGREMGNLLHDALVGEGHINLIKAWEKLYKRKPTVQELHLMLTTGRVNPERHRPVAAPSPPPAAANERKEMAAAPKVPNVPVMAAKVLANPVAPNANAAVADPVETPMFSTWPEPRPKSSQARKRQILTYLFHASVCAAAIVAYLWFF